MDLKNDARALATLIAARNVNPPLSIGIFGEGGSGKTFFMQQVVKEVDHITQDANNSSQQQDAIYFYQHIIQLEFNACHYIEGNFWASLVQHIFTSLDKACLGKEEFTSPKLQKEYLDNLESQHHLQQQEAREQLTQALDKEEKAERKYEKAANKLAGFNAQNITARVFANPLLQGNIEELLEIFGLPEVKNDKPETFMEAFAEIQTLIKRRHSFFSYGTEGERRKSWLWLIGLVIAIPFSGIVAGLVTGAVNAQGLEQTIAVIASTTTFLGTGVIWLGRRAKWLNDKVAAVEKTAQSRDFLMAQEQARFRSESEEAEGDLEFKKNEYGSAQQASTAAQAYLARLEAEIAQVTPAQWLENHLRDRIQSNDYRQHLSSSYTFRQDFEKLLALLNLYHPSLANLEDPTQAPQVKGFPISRIVLYFDDLELCPPELVIYIFRAVQILLKYRLFVIVMALDVRWTTSLIHLYYGKLLRPQRVRARTYAVRANPSPADFLEKIIQVPFWLRPMSPDTQQNMVQELLKSSLDRENQLKPIKLELVQTTNAVPKTNLTPEALLIHKEEFEFIEKLGPILRGSPRTLKRFTNLYRLLKLSRPELTLEEFKAPMFLLSLVTNSPSLSIEFFLALRAATNNRTQADKGGKSFESWELFIKGVDERHKLVANPDWFRLKRWLLPQHGEPPLTADFSKLAGWINSVAIYSFFEHSFQLVEPECPDEMEK